MKSERFEMKKFFIPFILLALSIVFIVGCGTSATTSPAPTNAPAQATAAPAQPTAIAPVGIITATPESNSDAAPTTGSVAPFTKINLNTATAEQILTIPNTGNRMVREFQEYRPYSSITQFRREIGKYVDASTVSEYEKYIYVPVKVNESDAATLQQIPGVTADIAAQLIAARPYGTNQNFLAKLATFVEAGQVEFAQNYLQ